MEKFIANYHKDYDNFQILMADYSNYIEIHDDIYNWLKEQNTPKALCCLANIEYYHHNVIEAIAFIKEALEINPNYFPAQVELVHIGPHEATPYQIHNVITFSEGVKYKEGTLYLAYEELARRKAIENDIPECTKACMKAIAYDPYLNEDDADNLFEAKICFINKFLANPDINVDQILAIFTADNFNETERKKFQVLWTLCEEIRKLCK